MSNIDIRSFASEPALNAQGRIQGYAVVYGQLSRQMSFPNMGRFREVIRPGAATESLRSGDVPMLFNHKPDNLLGRTSSGTLTLTEDQKGVFFSLDVPDTQLGRDVRELVKRGDIRGASFHITVPPGGDSWSSTTDGRVRSVNKIQIAEVSLTPYPAYEQTSAALRSFEEWEQAQKVPLSIRLAQVKLARL